MENLSDQQYISLIIKGDTNVFRVLVDRYKDMVFTVALKMLKNREEAEEISQDTFIKVFKSLQTFKGESKFSTWIYKVTYYTCLDRLKKNKKESYTILIDDFSEHLVKTVDNALNILEEKEQKQAIRNCIDLLSIEEGFIITLYYFDDQNLEEIAEILGTNANNIKVKLFRIRKKLAVILKRQLEPEIVDYYERER